MAGADWTTLVVASIGVTGTISASWLGQRELRWQSREQTKREQKAQTDERSKRASSEREQLYIALNSAARAYRMVLIYNARSLLLGNRITDDQHADVEKAHAAFGAQYARAQMLAPQRVLLAASEVAHCLGVGCQLLTRVDQAGDRQRAAREALSWARDTGTEAVALLRTALREDLGVDPSISDLDERIAKIAASRVSYENEPDAVCPPSGTRRRSSART